MRRYVRIVALLLATILGRGHPVCALQSDGNVECLTEGPWLAVATSGPERVLFLHGQEIEVHEKTPTSNRRFRTGVGPGEDPIFFSALGANAAVLAVHSVSDGITLKRVPLGGGAEQAELEFTEPASFAADGFGNALMMRASKLFLIRPNGDFLQPVQNTEQLGRLVGLASRGDRVIVIGNATAFSLTDSTNSPSLSSPYEFFDSVWENRLEVHIERLISGDPLLVDTAEGLFVEFGGSFVRVEDSDELAGPFVGAGRVDDQYVVAAENGLAYLDEYREGQFTLIPGPQIAADSLVGPINDLRGFVVLPGARQALVTSRQRTLLLNHGELRPILSTEGWSGRAIAVPFRKKEALISIGPGESYIFGRYGASDLHIELSDLHEASLYPSDNPVSLHMVACHPCISLGHDASTGANQAFQLDVSIRGPNERDKEKASATKKALHQDEDWITDLIQSMENQHREKGYTDRAILDFDLLDPGYIPKCQLPDGDSVDGVDARIDAFFENPGTYELDAEFTIGSVMLASRGFARIVVSAPPTSSTKTNTKEILVLIGAVAAALHTLLFSTAIIGARYSSRLWDLAFDRYFAPAGLWFYFLLRHLRFVQLWVLDLYVRQQQPDEDDLHYLPMPLRLADGSMKLSSTLDELLRRPGTVWLIGRPGLGKTTTASYLRQKFVEASTLGAFGTAKKKGGILIAIDLRRFRFVPEGERGGWLVDLTQAAFASNGLAIPERTIVARMIATELLYVVVDGANDRDSRERIAASCELFPKAHVLVTSQAEAPSSTFVTLRLPESINEYLPLLLETLKGLEYRNAFLSTVPRRALETVTSGYDVRLLMRLFESGSLSGRSFTNRSEFYALTLRQLCEDAGRDVEVHLCSHAWAWWCTPGADENVRPSTALPLDVLRSMSQSSVAILTEGEPIETFRFHHEEMIYFLAGRWLALHDINPQGLLEASPKVWRQPRKAQESMWSLCAEQLSDKLLEPLWRFACSNADRASLQQALQDYAQRRGVRLSLSGDQGRTRSG